jgi:hypothetical protein
LLGARKTSAIFFSAMIHEFYDLDMWSAHLD